MQRRDFLKSATFVAVASFLPPSVASAAEVAAPFVLPPLGFDFKALEPHIDATTMEIHHDKHHKAYVDNLNKAISEAPPEWSRKSLAELLYLHGPNGTAAGERPEDMPAKLRAAVRNQGGGHYNHSLFWQVITPGGENRPSGAMAAAINKQFGDFETFRKQFTEGALGRFGSGWEWLSQDSTGKLKLHSTANQDCPVSDGLNPLFGIDVWEHAYYLHYQNRRADYLAAIWDILNWTTISKRFRAA